MQSTRRTHSGNGPPVGNRREIPPQELRTHVGYVPQRPAFRDGTVEENVTIGPRLRGESIDPPVVDRLLERVDLAGYAGRTVDDLSGGESQRVAIVRTLLTELDVLLLDEPMSSLDAEAEAKIEALLTDLIGERTLTCVLVTHDRAQVKRLAERVAVLEDDRLQQVSDVTQVSA